MTDLELQVASKLKEGLEFIGSLEHLGSVSCRRCGWTQWVLRRPEEPIFDALAKTVKNLEEHLETRYCGKPDVFRRDE